MALVCTGYVWKLRLTNHPEYHSKMLVWKSANVSSLTNILISQDLWGNKYILLVGELMPCLYINVAQQAASLC